MGRRIGLETTSTLSPSHGLESRETSKTPSKRRTVEVLESVASPPRKPDPVLRKNNEKFRASRTSATESKLPRASLILVKKPAITTESHLKRSSHHIDPRLAKCVKFNFVSKKTIDLYHTSRSTQA